MHAGTIAFCIFWWRRQEKTRNAFYGWFATGNPVNIVLL